jgi:hypothetical protein
MSTLSDACPICGVVDCGGVVYPLLVERYLAGRNREHWRRIHDRKAVPVDSPDDLALRAYVAKRGGCCP